MKFIKKLLILIITVTMVNQHIFAQSTNDNSQKSIVEISDIQENINNENNYKQQAMELVSFKEILQEMDLFEQNYARIQKNRDNSDNRDDIASSEKNRVEGLFVDIQKELKEIDKNSIKTDSIFENSTLKKRILDMLHNGTIIKHKIESALKTSAPQQDKFLLILKYIEQILLPIREISLLAWNSKETNQTKFQNAEKYLISFPKEIIAESINGTWNINDRAKALLEIGPDPKSDNHAIQIVDDQKNQNNYRIIFDPIATLTRDTISALKAPTVNNYMDAMKWSTMYKILVNILYYRGLQGKTTPYETPNVCKISSGGNLPNKIDKLNAMSEEDLETHLDRYLAANGLSYSSQDTSDFHSYYFLKSANVFETSFNGNLPFLRYSDAHNALKTNFSSVHSFTINDMLDFFYVRESRYYLAKKKIKTNPYNPASVLRDQNTEDFPEDVQQIIQQRLNLFDKIFKLAKESFPPDASNDDTAIQIEVLKNDVPVKATLYTSSVPYNQFIIDKMNQYKTLSIRDIVSKNYPQTYKTLAKDNSEISIPFPQNSAPNFWKRWALESIKSGITKAQSDETSKQALYNFLEKNCSNNKLLLAQSKGICTNNNKMIKSTDKGESIAQNILDSLSYFSDPLEGEYLPNLPINEAQLYTYWPLFTIVWNYLTSNMLIENLGISEFDFLLGQIEAGNPWSILRITHLMNLEDIQRITNENYINQKQIELAIFKEIGKIYKLNETLLPFHGNKILKEEEKENLIDNILTDENATKGGLFATKYDKDKTFYHAINSIFKKLILTPEDAINGLQELDLINNNSKHFIMFQNKLQKISQGTKEEEAALFKELFTNHSNAKEQQRIAQKILQKREQNIADKNSQNFEDEIDEKEIVDSNAEIDALDIDVPYLFMIVDSGYKRIIYHYLIIEAAERREKELTEGLNLLCPIETSDVEDFRKQYYMTYGGSKDLYKLGNLPTIPKEVVDRLTDWSNADKKNMLWSLGTLATLLPAMIIMAGCASPGALFCEPLTLIFGGTSAIGGLLTGAKAFQISFEEYQRIQKKTDDVIYMEYLGFTDRKSIKDNHKSTFTAIFDGISLVPLLGPMLRGTLLTSKIGKTALKLFVRTSIVNASQGKPFFKYSLKKMLSSIVSKEARKIGFSISQEVDRASAKIILLMDNADNLTNEIINGSRKLQNAQIETINKHFANGVANRYNNNAVLLKRDLQKYGSEKIRRYSEKITEYNKYDSSIRKYLVNPKVIAFEKWRISQMQNIVEQTSIYKKLESGLDKVIGGNGNLSDFIKKNADDLSIVFKDFSFHIKELPYMSLVQGTPVAPIATPALSTWNNRILINRLITAREFLLAEEYRKIIPQKIFNTEKTFEKINAYKLLQDFFNTSHKSTQDLILSGKNSESVAISSEIDKIQQKISSQVLKHYKTQKPNAKYNDIIISNLTEGQMSQYLFSPQSLEEEIFAEAIFNKSNLAQVFSDDTFLKLLRKLPNQISEKPTISSINARFNAFKLLFVSENIENLSQYF